MTLTAAEHERQVARVRGSLLADDSRLTLRTVYPVRRPRPQGTPDVLGRLAPERPEGAR